MMKKRVFQAIASGVFYSGWTTSILLPVSAITVHAQSSKETANTISAVNIEAYGELFAKATPVASPLSKVFIYRSNVVPVPQPVNIYLDGRYHTSLLKGGFSEFCVTPGAMPVQAVLDDASRQHLGKQDAGQRLQFDAGKTLFLRLQESAYAPPQLTSGQCNCGANGAQKRPQTDTHHFQSQSRS